MKQQEFSLEDALIYVTANSLMNDDITLSAAIHIARDAGADGFELRRELLPPTMQLHEIEGIRSQLQTFASPPMYSIPRPLCKKDRFEQEPLLQALDDARAFGCHLVKFSPIGMEPGDNNFAWLSELRSLLRSAAADLVVTVENDQGAASGNLELWQSFFEQAKAVECPIWMTFDLGNWTCVGSDPVQAAQRLGRYVAYVHAKAVERKDGQCISQPFRTASAPHPALAYLPPDAPRAIEFPLAGETQEAVSTTLRSYIIQLRSGNFVL
jgi:sugar phosphate isomerase/epimerase